MTKEQYIENIIKAIGISNAEAAKTEIKADTRFDQIPNMDSMSIVNFQLDLTTLIGERASEVLPVPEMTVGDYAELLTTL